MRILVANDLYGRSSAAGVAVRIAEGLATKGHDVAFLATTQEPTEAREFTEGGVAVRVVYTPPYNLRWRAWRSLDNPPGVAAIVEMVQEFRPDIVHIHNLHLHLSYASLSAVRQLGVPVALHVHDIMPVCHQKMFCHLDERKEPGDHVDYRAGPLKCPLCVRTRYNPFRNRVIRRAIREQVDLPITVSPQIAAALQANDLGEFHVVFNGITMTAGAVSKTCVADLRKKLGLGSRKVIFHGGRLDRLKGSLELVEALEQVRRSVPDAVLLTVGNALPGFAEEIDALAHRLGMKDAVIHAGWLTGEELDTAYALADVVASPSLCFESFGLMNLEAMRASKPVVASFWGGPSDVVRDGVTGYLVNPLQIGAMADRLTRILQDQESALRMGREGRKWAEESFSVVSQVARVEELFADCLAARAATRHTDLT